MLACNTIVRKAVDYLKVLYIQFLILTINVGRKGLETPNLNLSFQVQNMHLSKAISQLF